MILATNRLSIRDASRMSNVWRAHLVGVGDAEREYCKTSRVSLDKLSQSHIGATGETGLVEQILKLLRIKHISRLVYLNNMQLRRAPQPKFITLKEDGTAAFVSQ